MVKDAEEAECDLEADFDTNVQFDDKRSSLDGDALEEQPENTAGIGGGFVVTMAAIDGSDVQVRRSFVWVQKSSWDTLPLQ